MQSHSLSDHRFMMKAETGAGFTLLEILLVIVVISVTTMMVAPSFISLSSPTLKDETNRLVKLIRFASDETMLSGWPLRISLHKNGYQFETPDTEGEWKVLQDEIYSSYQLPEPFAINEIRPESGLSERDKPENEGEQPVIGRVLLLPTGVQFPSEIVLSEHNVQLTILIRPGPNGIRIEEVEDE